MMRALINTLVLPAILAGGLAAGLAAPVSAQGLVDIHEQRAEGGRWCVVGHTHSAVGSGTTKALAEREAIGNWSGFTAWEYGNEWGSWRIAASRTVVCSGSAGSVSCSIEARPCRPLGLSTRKAKPKS